MTLLRLRSTFPVFPDGLPGVGLLLLRATAGAAVVSFGMIHLIGGQEAKVVNLIVAMLSFVCGLLLLFGMFNWFASGFSALISLGAALAPIRAPSSNEISFKVAAVFTAAIAIALLCLGPGAYSLDARWHGRREIIIPARSRPSDKGTH